MHGGADEYGRNHHATIGGIQMQLAAVLGIFVPLGIALAATIDSHGRGGEYFGKQQFQLLSDAGFFDFFGRAQLAFFGRPRRYIF